MAANSIEFTLVKIDERKLYVVHVVEVGRLNVREWADKPKEKLDEFWKAYEWWSRRQEKDAAINNDQGIVIILDYDGYSLKKYASSHGNPVFYFTSVCYAGTLNTE